MVSEHLDSKAYNGTAKAKIQALTKIRRGPKIKAATKLQPGRKTQKQVRFQPGAQRKAKFLPEAEREAKVQQREPKFQPEAEREAKFQPEAERKAKFQPEAEREAKFQPEAQREAKFQPEAQREATFQPEAQREAKVQPKSMIETVAKFLQEKTMNQQEAMDELEDTFQQSEVTLIQPEARTLDEAKTRIWRDTEAYDPIQIQARLRLLRDLKLLDHKIQAAANRMVTMDTRLQNIKQHLLHVSENMEQTDSQSFDPSQMRVWLAEMQQTTAF
jgi:hypothetical protein